MTSAFAAQAFPGEAGIDQILAAAFQPELFAACLDLDGLPYGLEPEAACEAIRLDVHIPVLEFHDIPAVDADEVVVGGFLKEIRIVGDLAFPEIDLAEQIRLHQQPEGAVNGGAGCLSIDLADAVVEFLSGEMLVLRENDIYNVLALHGAPQPFAPDEFIEPFLDATVHLPVILSTAVEM
jgi:hypothetical protein